MPTRLLAALALPLLLLLPRPAAAVLLVSSQDTDQVLRYDGSTGAFLDAFVQVGSGGLDTPTFLIFTPELVGVPEPSSLMLLGLGALALAGYSWRRASEQPSNNSSSTSILVQPPAGNAQPPLASVLLWNANRPHRRREVRPRRHAIPDLVQVVLQIPLERRDTLRIDTGRSAIRPHPLLRLHHHPLGNTERLRLARRLLPLARLTVSTSWMTRPLRSIGSPRLLRSYGSLRPCASHRYAHPRGSTTWISPLASRRQVPTFRTRAWLRVTPPLCRVSSRQAAVSPWTGPRLTTRPGFDTVPTLSTRSRWFTAVRLSEPYLTRSRRAVSGNAHHPGSLPEQLPVVWSLP
jgi:PEP-CTERM motif